MKTIFKYWRNDNSGVTCIPCVCQDYKDVKATAKRLLNERPDIDNLEVYMDNKVVVNLYNINTERVMP